MLTIEEVRRTLHNPDLSDEELLQIRDGFNDLSEIIFESWQRDRRKGLLNTFKNDSDTKIPPKK